ncbi:MAG TPA: antibiotic biosynthesis monooxygenase [Jiangellaceae bacterium]|nr:antibiotic biosynthesis monooxygenase [Jiangellaceae bacterium]
MLAVTRYRIDPTEAAAFLAQARAALAVLADRPGWRTGHVGRATDDPALWLLISEWDDVGSYRRALSAYEVKVTAVPLLSRAIDEPTAFEVLTDADGHGSALAGDAGLVGVGEAAAPVVSTDLD